MRLPGSDTVRKYLSVRMINSLSCLLIEAEQGRKKSNNSEIRSHPIPRAGSLVEKRGKTHVQVTSCYVSTEAGRGPTNVRPILEDNTSICHALSASHSGAGDSVSARFWGIGEG